MPGIFKIKCSNIFIKNVFKFNFFLFCAIYKTYFIFLYYNYNKIYTTYLYYCIMFQCHRYNYSLLTIRIYVILLKYANFTVCCYYIILRQTDTNDHVVLPLMYINKLYNI